MFLVILFRQCPHVLVNTLNKMVKVKLKIKTRKKHVNYNLIEEKIK